MKRLLDLALDVVPRVLGLTDRLPDSHTAGCCDRYYWQYRLLDVANARFQEIGLLLALIYSTPHPANRFASNTRIAEWVRMVWSFWLKQRNSDGSVVEVYPFERSFCATAFSTSAFLETIRLMGGAWTSELRSVENTMRWLASNANLEVANQMMASWHALHAYAEMTGDRYFQDAAERRRKLCLDMQDESGVFPEYGGLDVGYQTITMSSLASIVAMRPDDSDAVKSLRRAETALLSRITDTGAVNPLANSRGTQYIYPHALARLDSPLLQRFLSGVDNGNVLRPTWLDDRYCHALAADYLLAYRVRR